MKKQNIKGLALIAVAGTMVTSCDLLKDLDYTVTPDPLEMHGDSVKVKIDVTFPEKGIHRKASAEITPQLASTSLKTITVQGEKAEGNGTVIQYKPGGKLTYTDVVPYKSDMETADLVVSGKVYKGGKDKGDIEETKIADATVITPFLVNKDYKVIYEKDAFQRVTEESTFAQVNYLKGKSNVRSSEMNDEDIEEYGTWLAEAQSNPKIEIKSINVTGYASPEGETAKNDNLSTDRANTGKETAMKVASSSENEAAQGEIYSLNGRGEDYEGFKRELEKSDINEDEKNLIIRVLEMHSNPVKREEEMRAMGQTFKKLDREIFPLLRRSEINTVYDLTGFSDEELKAISQSNADSLNVEELLFAATLTDDLNEKKRLYEVAASKDAEDHRPVNNIGAVLYQQNKLSEAKAKFEKANGIKDNSISKNNLAAIAGMEGNPEKALELLEQAGGGDQVGYNKGILDIQAGNYASAVSNFGSEETYNKALAQLLNGSTSEAVSTIDASEDAESGQGYYLKAIAAAREDNVDKIIDNLKSAIAKDSSYTDKASKDREFIKYLENPLFMNVINM